MWEQTPTRSSNTVPTGRYPVSPSKPHSNPTNASTKISHFLGQLKNLTKCFSPLTDYALKIMLGSWRRAFHQQQRELYLVRGAAPLRTEPGRAPLSPSRRPRPAPARRESQRARPARGICPQPPGPAGTRSAAPGQDPWLSGSRGTPLRRSGFPDLRSSAPAGLPRSNPARPCWESRLESPS